MDAGYCHETDARPKKNIFVSINFSTVPEFEKFLAVNPVYARALTARSEAHDDRLRVR